MSEYYATPPHGRRVTGLETISAARYDNSLTFMYSVILLPLAIIVLVRLYFCHDIFQVANVNCNLQLKQIIISLKTNRHILVFISCFTSIIIIIVLVVGI